MVIAIRFETDLIDDKLDTTIVGVVKDATYVNLRKNIRRHFYIPVAQLPRLFDLALHVKTSVAPAVVADQLRGEIKALDPHLPLYNVKTLEGEIDAIPNSGTVSYLVVGGVWTARDFVDSTWALQRLDLLGCATHA